MKLNFDRRKIETTCIFISFSLIILLSLLGILVMADNILNWDLLSDKLEKIAALAIITTGTVVSASFIISLMVNFSLISMSMEKMADGLNKQNTKENEK